MEKCIPTSVVPSLSTSRDASVRLPEVFWGEPGDGFGVRQRSPWISGPKVALTLAIKSRHSMPSTFLHFHMTDRNNLMDVAIQSRSNLGMLIVTWHQILRFPSCSLQDFLTSPVMGLIQRHNSVSNGIMLYPAFSCWWEQTHHLCVDAWMKQIEEDCLEVWWILSSQTLGSTQLRI